MAAITRLGSRGYGVKRTGSFAGKTVPAPDAVILRSHALTGMQSSSAVTGKQHGHSVTGKT